MAAAATVLLELAEATALIFGTAFAEMGMGALVIPSDLSARAAMLALRVARRIWIAP